MDFENIAALRSVLDQELPPSPWVTVTQKMINDFAEATLDFQWIHIDVEKAKKESPFKGPIAHGFLSLSLVPHLMGEHLTIKSVKMGVNYGVNKVRFTSPVPAGARLRLNPVKLISSEDYGDNGARNTWACVIEMEGSDKPACIAEFISIIFE